MLLFTHPFAPPLIIMQFVNPAILDMEPTATLLAKLLTPLKKRKAKGPQITRKKLHWVPIKVSRRLGCIARVVYVPGVMWNGR